MVFVLFSALFAIACCCDWRFFCAQQAGTPVTDSNCSSQVSLFQSPWFAECAQPARSCEGDGQCLEANVCTSLGGEISSSVSSCPQSVQGSSGMGTPNVACCVGAKTFQPDAWIVSTSVGNVKAKWSVCSSVSPKGEIIGAFRGIPFAAPPVGALRFAAPIQPARLGGTIESVAPPLCAQLPPPPDGNFTASISGFSEDCLYLNVFAPSSVKASSKKAVMVFFPGGGFVSGGSALPTYDGTCLASQDVIVVTANYRLGIFGGFASSELMANGSSSGAYGFLDQQMVLKWVHENIELFGGDSNKVTIFGQSAGAFSVCMHNVASQSRPGVWFQRVVSESGPCMSPTPLINQQQVITGMVPLDYALQRSKTAMQSLNCTDVACMRRASVDALLAAASIPGVSWNFAQDGVAMPTLSMFELWQRRSYNASVDVIVGACRNDYDLLLPPLSDLTWDQLPFAIDNFVANASLAQGLFLYYNTTGRESTAFLTLRRLFDDSLLCSIEYQSHCAARAGVTGAFSYIFDHRPAWLPPAFSGFGAYHTAELPFVFNNAWDVSFSSVPFTEEESKLASSIMSPLWAAFATGGVPVVPEFSWKPWTMEGDGGTAFLSSTPSMRSSVLNDKPCLIWNLVNLFPC